MEYFVDDIDLFDLSNESVKKLFSKKILAVFLGGAIGDSMGLPAEMLSSMEISKRFGYLDYLEESKLNYFFEKQGFDKDGIGHISDDTLLTMATAESLVTMGKINMDDIAFRNVNYCKSQPYGFGKATLEAFDKISQGISYKESGTLGGSGNGVMMKQSPLAVYFLMKGSSEQEIVDTIVDFTRMTHDSNVAIICSLVHNRLLINLLRIGISNAFKGFREILSDLLDYCLFYEKIFTDTPQKVSDIIKKLINNLDKDTGILNMKDEQIFEDFGWGNSDIKSSCYVYFTIGIVYSLFFRHPDYQGLLDAVNFGGDTDSFASIVGNMVGALKGEFYPGDIASNIRYHDNIQLLSKRFSEIS